VAEARGIISGSGALAATEREIEDAAAEALSSLESAGIAAPARDGLRRLAGLASQREA